MHSDVYEKNLLELEKKNNALAMKLCNYSEPKTIISEVVSVEDRNVLAIIKNEEYVQLDSLYDSSLPVKSLIDGLVVDMALDAKLMMFGLGNGMYARYFLESTSEDHHIYVLEPSIDIFYSVIEAFDLTDLFKNKRFHIEVLNEANETSYRTYFNKLFVYTDIYTIKHTVYTNYQILFPEQVNCWVEQLQYTLSLMGSERKLYEDFGKTFVINNYASFPYVIKSKSLRKLAANMPNDVPAILVSAGPSLSKNVKELKKAKGKALIMAVEAAVNPLIKNGIVPDIMVSVDPTKGAEYISEKGASEIPLVSGMNCCEGLTTAHTGEKIYVSDLNPFVENFFIRTCGMLPQLGTGGSVSNSAFHLAHLLGCKRIILVGQDLAYTGEKSHAEGSVRGKETMDQLIDIEKDIDIFGNPILTSRMFIWFKTWFEDYIVKHGDIRVINATEGGIMIKGTEVMTLNDAIYSECNKEFDFSKIIEKTGYLLDVEQGEKFIEYITNLPNELDKVVLQIHEGLKCYSTIKRIVAKGNLNSKELRDSALKANDILDDIQDNYYLEYVKYLIQEYTNVMLQTINNTNSDTKKELIEISNIGTEYLKHLEKEINTLKELIKECVDKWNQ